ncbi:hypothetical protein [Flavobacterium subsaxonicum]|uniref:Uncharacterized protein n=1 Tax=Flavobacterium subsaxonicum WB 4.1-42 = DSM 21790 TaxID=1121898 RepID=A0A0A2MJS1_9FLAO|nr:hypothetical protein [Flavobacterium subsaxonicum]KGO92539.1 hypothetical protein Q766_12215 [Flavobacterium subsaxonicum WB 4.1-42 = DSM 21790]
MKLLMLDILDNEKIFPVVISTITTIVVFFLTLLTKNFIDTRILRSKLNTEHKFDQRKKIKEVLAKHKVHLLSACEDFNYRMWNFANNHNNNWLKVNGNYLDRNTYYFQSFIYRLLAVLAWSKKIQKDMIYLDTTIASKEDLDFIKILNIFPCMFCDLTFLEGLQANTNNTDHFYKNEFDHYAYYLITDDGIKSFSTYLDELSTSGSKLNHLFLFFDGMSPLESRKRWDRCHLFQITVIAFLNNYGYDFQKTDPEKFKEILNLPKRSSYLPNYFKLLDDYCLMHNKKIKELKKIAKV